MASSNVLHLIPVVIHRVSLRASQIDRLRKREKERERGRRGVRTASLSSCVTSQGKYFLN